MSKFIKSAAAAAVLATSATGTHAASLSTDIDVDLPSIIALYCYDSVTVDVSAAGLTAALGGAPETAGLGGKTITSFSDDLGAASNTAITAPNTTVDLQLNNVCAFRALVSNGVGVSVAQNATALDHATDTTASIGIPAAGVALTSATSVTTGLGLGAAPTGIDVKVPLDLTNATASGVYSEDEVFTVTVTAL